MTLDGVIPKHGKILLRTRTTDPIVPDVTNADADL